MAENKNNYLKIFTKGLWKESPTFKQVLGMCPTLAVTTAAENGLAMGLATTFVVFFSAILASLIRKIVPDGVRIPVYAVVIATFVTIADLFLKAFFPALSTQLGPFVPLIVVNCIIMGRVEAFATKNKVVPSIFDSLGMGLGFTFALLVLGSIRELLGNGTIFGINIIQGFYKPMMVMILAPGAFFTLGLLLGFYNYLNRQKV